MDDSFEKVIRRDYSLTDGLKQRPKETYDPDSGSNTAGNVRDVNDDICFRGLPLIVH